MECYGLFHERIHSQHGAQPTSQKWVGLYKNADHTMLQWVVCVGYLRDFRFGPVGFSADFKGASLNPMFGRNTLPLPR